MNFRLASRLLTGSLEGRWANWQTEFCGHTETAHSSECQNYRRPRPSSFRGSVFDCLIQSSSVHRKPGGPKWSGRRDLNPLTPVCRYAQLSQAIDSMRQSIAAIACYCTVFRWDVSRMLAPSRPDCTRHSTCSRIGAPAWLGARSSSEVKNVTVPAFRFVVALLRDIPRKSLASHSEIWRHPRIGRYMSTDRWSASRRD